MEFTPENIEKALLQFYHDAHGQHAVHQWLTAAQVAPEAWNFSWELLKPGKSQEVQFFGASCLYVKISRYWHEVPEERVVQLRTQLLEQIAAFSTGPKIVLTRLCVALASLALYTMPSIWPNAVMDILSAFQQANLPHLTPTQVCVVLLEILTVLPEEFFTSHLTQHKRGIVRNELVKALNQVLPLLQSVMAPSSPTAVHDQALRCFSSWVQFGIPVIDSEPLIVVVFKALQNQDLFDTAVETLVQVFSHQENYRYPACMTRLLPHILDLGPHLTSAINNKDMDLCQSLVRLIVCAADNCSKLILNLTNGEDKERDLAINLVKLVLECTAIPGHYPVDEICSDISFGFWYNLQDDLLALGMSRKAILLIPNVFYSPGASGRVLVYTPAKAVFERQRFYKYDDIVASEPIMYAILGQVYIPTYMSLVDILLQKAQYPPEDEYHSWNAEEKERHRCYRQDISDTLMYAYNLLHNMVLVNLVRLFQSIIQRSAHQTVPWQEVEAVIFAVTALAENVDHEEGVCLPQLFNMLSQIPCTHEKLVSQALYLIGAYAEWISTHPEVLGSVVPLLLQGLQSTELAQSATLSLKEVVRENQEHLMPFVTSILSVSKHSLDSNILKPRDTVRLMACLGYVLSVLPVDTIMNDLNVILSPHIQKLQEAAQLQPSATTKSVILVKLNMLCWLFGSLNTRWRDENEDGASAAGAAPAAVTPGGVQPQPALLILQQCLPILSQVATVWASDPAIIEALSELLKKPLRTLMDDFAPLIDDVSHMIVNLYNAVPQPTLLDLSKQLMLLFASDVKNESYNANGRFLFHSLCTRSLALFETGFQNHPDVVDAFMAFLSQVVKKYAVVLQDDSCNRLGLFQSGIVALGMPESPTVKSACSFLTEFVVCGTRIDNIKEIVESHGQDLIDKLMRAIGGDSPRAVIDSMADVLLVLNRHHFDGLCRWMTNVMNQDGFPNPRATHQDKEQFARKILKERGNKRRLKEAVQEYTLLWRGLLGTEYAAQTQSIIDPAS